MCREYPGDQCLHEKYKVRCIKLKYHVSSASTIAKCPVVYMKYIVAKALYEISKGISEKYLWWSKGHNGFAVAHQY